MGSPDMEFPKHVDFEDQRPPRRPNITFERLAVLGLLLVGALFLGAATELWPVSGAPADEETELKHEIFRNVEGGNFEQALLLAKRLIEINPKAGYADRGRVYYLMGEYEKALEDFSNLIKKAPDTGEGYRMRSITLKQLNRTEDALKDADKLIEFEPRDGHLLKSDIYQGEEKYDEALAELDKAAEIDPMYLRTFLDRYQLHTKLDKNEDALKDAEKITELAPGDGEIYRGDALAKLGRYEDSTKAYTKAIEANPLNATAYNNRAYHRATAGKDLDEAEKDVARALELAGPEPAYIDTRGFISYLKGDMRKALADFNTALADDILGEIDPAFFAEIYFHRGLVYRKLGEEKLAKEDFERAKELGFTWKELPEPVGKPL